MLGAKVLSLSKSLNSVCSLNISYNRIEPLGISSLANSVFGQQLKFLKIRDTCLGNEGVKRFTPFRLNIMESLDLSENSISDSGLEALAISNSFPKIKKLELNNNHIGDDGIYALSQSNMFCNLQSLFLANNDLTTDSAISISKSPALTQLKSLDINNNDIRAEGTKALSESSNLKSIEYLDLGENRLGADGAKALAKSPNMKTLKFLRLNNNNIQDVGISALAKSKYFTSLENLFLDNENWIHSDGAESLANSTAFPMLRKLVLTLNVIGDEGAFHLAEKNNLNALEELNVAGNKISSRGEDALRNSPYLQHLKTLELV